MLALRLSQMLSNVYEREFSRTLWGDLKSDTSGDFRNALKGLVMTEAQFLAEEMRSAMVQSDGSENVRVRVIGPFEK